MQPALSALWGATRTQLQQLRRRPSRRALRAQLADAQQQTSRARLSRELAVLRSSQYAQRIARLEAENTRLRAQLKTAQTPAPGEFATIRLVDPTLARGTETTNETTTQLGPRPRLRTTAEDETTLTTNATRPGLREPTPLRVHSGLGWTQRNG